MFYVQLGLVAIGCVAGFFGRAKLKRTPMTDEERSQAFCAFAFGVVIWSCLALFSFFEGMAWGLIGSALGIYLPALHYLLMGSGKVVWPRFSARYLLGTFTTLTVLIAVIVGSERWLQGARHQAEVDGYRMKRARIESRREQLSPDYYEKVTRELDREAARLGIE